MADAAGVLEAKACCGALPSQALPSPRETVHPPLTGGTAGSATHCKLGAPPPG